MGRDPSEADNGRTEARRAPSMKLKLAEPDKKSGDGGEGIDKGGQGEGRRS